MTRLGILKCDSVRPELVAAHGDYPDMFERLLLPLAPRLQLRVYDVQHGDYPSAPGDCDAYLLTGSKAGVYDPEPWIAALMDYARSLYRLRIPAVGVCFGHQLLAHALGGHAGLSERGWGVGVRRLAVEPGPRWMRPRLASLALLYSHRDQVSRLPPGARRLAGDGFCPNALFEIEDRVLGCQGHPEFTPEYADCLLTLRRDLIGEPVVARARASLGEPRDHRVMAGWILRFVGVEPAVGMAPAQAGP